ncbi:MAG: hypothetical protein ACK4K8_11240 [Pannonibacter sp.]
MAKHEDGALPDADDWHLTLVSDDAGLVLSISALLLADPQARVTVTGSADVLTGLRSLTADVVLIDADSVTDIARLVGSAVLIQPAPVAVIGLHVSADLRTSDLCRSRGASLVHPKVCGTADIALAGHEGDALLAALQRLARDPARRMPLARPPVETAHGRS